MYYLHGVKLPRLFETLTDFVAAELGILNSGSFANAVVQIAEQIQVLRLVCIQKGCFPCL